MNARSINKTKWGKTVTHKFDVSARQKLNSEERKRLLVPEETLERLGFKNGDIFADIGCGTGLFTIPAAQRSPVGTVYAVDISQEMLDDVAERAQNEGLHNIQTVKSQPYDFGLESETADFVLMCTVLHEIDEPERFLREAARVCRSGGRVAVVEFSEANTGFGPPLSHRMKQATVTELLVRAGFENPGVTEIGEAFYAVTAQKTV